MISLVCKKIEFIEYGGLLLSIDAYRTLQAHDNLNVNKTQNASWESGPIIKMACNSQPFSLVLFVTNRIQDESKFWLINFENCVDQFFCFVFP